MSAAPEEMEKELDLAIMPARMPLAESQRVVYAAIVPEEVTREHLRTPAFWKHVANKLKPTYRIEVINDNYDFFAEYLVIDSGHNWAVVEELRFVELGQYKKVSQENEKKLYKIVQKGPHLKFCVIRLEDNEVIKDRMGKEEAETFLKEYLKTLERAG